MSQSQDLVVCWISSNGSFQKESPEESVHIQITFGSCWISPMGRVTFPKPYNFEVFSSDGSGSLKLVSSGKSMRLKVYPQTELRVYTPDGILRVLRSFPIFDEGFYASLLERLG